MISKIKYFLFIVVLAGCRSTPKEKALTKVNDFKEKIEKLSLESSAKIDTAFINTEYYKIDIPSISDESFAEISNEASFIQLLKTEKDLLDEWEPIKGFQAYSGTNADTLLKMFRRCGTIDRAPADANRRPSVSGMRTVSLEYYKIEVPIAFHIIANKERVGLQGNMKARIDGQINVLNDVYAKFNISFKLNSIDTTFEDTWFNTASPNVNVKALKEMTKKLAKNPAKVMNVYSLSLSDIGVATFPWDNSLGTSMDYVLINYNSLPGGPNTYYNGMYNEGKTLLHEVGHFLGLLHTFEGGNQEIKCDSTLNNGCGIGDQVDDTPAQKICYFYGCDENSDSCPSMPGKDPVKNYMGYNPDACMNQFTKGQQERLLQSIIKYRYYLVVNHI